ncbi:multidomain presynaptic cytomatrix related protein [Aspergillus novofumigatus IBT 16806]|uniref:Autophagy-related protein 29 n=1 Tax=Aspergillus novofumigatus (strain IBT 16806) TaxID=1392255 RepID=A0A2I1C287_ASPN1|nr:multidomain presynaptic cytomatrix related protein [Aspergillus novofumigatus IBT 16806]PKX91744.1 multidomain presynaptic cytomatrix related protein [Aspergillus novofumigatus IBT 16806]
MAFHHQAGDTRFTAEWNAAKDQALWDILSRPAKGDDIDCEAFLADSFDVTLQFLLQQAAWLYDRQLSQVRAQMRKVGTTHSTSPSPAPGSMTGSAALGGQQPKGISGAAQGQRAPSRLVSQPKDTLPQRGPRRTSSTTTISQLKGQKEMSRNETPPADTKDTKWEGYGRRPSINRKEQAVQALLQRSPTLEEEDLSSSESESDSDGDVMLSRMGPRFKRFGKLSTHRPGLRDDEEDEDESPAFLPLARESEEARREPSRQDLNATLRLEAEHAAAQRRRLSEQESITRKPITAESSTSSVSSGPTVPLRQGDSRRVLHQSGGGVFGPQRTAEPARSSPRRSIASGKDASDTPSMGSSFSDLDDASVTQSALEEALMSNMQHGGMASRMSTISQALRSRYL